VEKCVGHSLKNLGPLKKALRPPGVPSWLRDWTGVSKLRATGQIRLTKLFYPAANTFCP